MIEVNRDLFRIAERLLKINPKYRVFWNGFAKRFEVHTREMEFVVPFDRLDIRTILHALKTRAQNADAIEKEIADHNTRLGKRAEEKFVGARAELADMFAFANRAGRKVDFTRNYLKEF
jgi:hypothetical protein